MHKYIVGIIGILIGLLINIYTFFFTSSVNLSIMFIIFLLGFAVSIFTLIKFKEKMLSIIGIILNSIPIIYFLILYIGIA